MEFVNDELKNIAQIEHLRHRSFTNCITNALSTIAAYCFFPKKPSISRVRYQQSVDYILISYVELTLFNGIFIKN